MIVSGTERIVSVIVSKTEEIVSVIFSGILEIVSLGMDFELGIVVSVDIILLPKGTVSVRMDLAVCEVVSMRVATEVDNLV